MALLRIRTLGDPILREKAKTITEFGANLQALVADMFETMYDAPGVGLAAPQVGKLLRLFVLDCADKELPPEPKVFVNPEIIPETEAISCEEGCLSVPGLYAQVKRPERITVRAQDVLGNPFELTGVQGLLCRCIQHENDHLDGILFVDKLSPTDRLLYESKLKKLQRQQKRS